MFNTKSNTHPSGYDMNDFTPEEASEYAALTDGSQPAYQRSVKLGKLLSQVHQRKFKVLIDAIRNQ